MAEARGVAAQFICWSTSSTAQMTERLCGGTTSGDAPAGFNPSIAKYQGRPFSLKVRFFLKLLTRSTLYSHCCLQPTTPCIRLVPYVLMSSRWHKQIRDHISGPGRDHICCRTSSALTKESHSVLTVDRNQIV